MSPSGFITPKTEVRLRSKLQNRKLLYSTFEHLWGVKIQDMSESMATIILEHWEETEAACGIMPLFFYYPVEWEDQLTWTLENIDFIKNELKITRSSSTN